MKNYLILFSLFFCFMFFQSHCYSEQSEVLPNSGHISNIKTSQGTVQADSVNRVDVKTVTVGDSMIMKDASGNEIGIVRSVAGKLLFYDRNGQLKGMILGGEGMALITDLSGKKLGMVKKFGNNYIFYSDQNQPE